MVLRVVVRQGGGRRGGEQAGYKWPSNRAYEEVNFGCIGARDPPARTGRPAHMPRPLFFPISWPSAPVNAGGPPKAAPKISDLRENRQRRRQRQNAVSSGRRKLRKEAVYFSYSKLFLLGVENLVWEIQTRGPRVDRARSRDIRTNTQHSTSGHNGEGRVGDGQGGNAATQKWTYPGLARSGGTCAP